MLPARFLMSQSTGRHLAAPPRAAPPLRRRLLDRLDAGQDARLTLVSAPAGAGKTTLLHDWLATADGYIALVTFTTQENDSARFWRTVDTVIRDLLPDGAALLPITSAETAIAALRALVAHVGHDVTLAFDDLHLLAPAAVQESLAPLLQHLPNAIHLVVGTRADPALPLSRLRSMGELVEIRGGDLALTPVECREFLNDVMRLGLTHREIEQVQRRTEGWAGGVRLAALALRESDDMARAAAAFGGNHPYVLDYLTDEVLVGVPDDVLTFLRETSIAETFCASLCEAITGSSHAQAMLRRLRQTNLFLIPLDDRSRWYRYARFFAEALSRRLEDEGPACMRELHRRAMRWYLQRGATPEGVRHALAAGDHDVAAEAVERQVDAMLWDRGEIAVLLGWLRAIPPDVVRARPRLLLAQAWALALSGQLQTIEEPLGLVEQSMRRRLEPASRHGDTAPTALSGPGTRGEIAAVRAVAAGLQVDISRLASWSTEAASLAPESLFLRSILALSRGRAFDIAADLDSAMAAYMEARDLSERIGNRHILAVATSRLAELLAVHGDLHGAAQAHRRVLALVEDGAVEGTAVGAMAHVGLGGLLYEWNDLAAASGQYAEGLKRASSWGHLETLKGSYFGLARVRFAQGASGEALELLAEAEEIARRSDAPRSIAWIHAMQARVHLAAGDLAATVHWSRTSPLHPDSSPLRLFTGEYTTLIRLLTAQRKFDEALGLIERLLRTATGERWAGLVIELLILRALVYRRRGSIRAALLPLRKALALAEPEGYLRTFLDEGAPLADLLARAGMHPEMPPYLQEVLAASATDARRGEPAVERQVLTAREQEVLRHIADGETNAEIAERLVLSVATVKRHLSTIFAKLGVTNRTGAVARARQRGLL